MQQAAAGDARLLPGLREAPSLCCIQVSLHAQHTVSCNCCWRALAVELSGGHNFTTQGPDAAALRFKGQGVDAPGAAMWLRSGSLVLKPLKRT